MTYNPLNRYEAQYQSGVKGFETPLTNFQPNPIITTVTGGGSISFTKDGANITPGGTSGDIARLEGADFDRNQAHGHVMIYHYLIKMGSSAPTDDFYVGNPRGIGNQGPSYVDLKNTQFVSGGQTASYTHPGQDEPAEIIVVMDIAASDAHFYLQNEAGSYAETATLPLDTGRFRGDQGKHYVHAKSNGGGDSRQILWMRHYTAAKEDTFL